jgi:CDP-6-deoxy-D-xylo-4-hexulose-3-dehydrase
VGWVTTVSPFIQFGLEPVLCDCDSKNLGLDIKHFEELCEKHNPAIAILVHVLGHPNDMSAIQEICQKHNVILLEDCCEAHGSKYDGKKVGTFGEMASFSFYFGHHISTIEGGMVVTDNEELYNLLLSLRSHGWSRDLEPDYASALKKKYQIDDFRDRYTFYYPGFNMRSTDLAAFIGLEQLKRLDTIVQKRYENYLQYKEALKPYYWIQESKGDPISSFAFGLISEDLLATVSLLEKNSIETRPLVCGSLGEQPFWIERYGKTVLPNASRIHHQGFYVSNYHDLEKSEIEKVCNILISQKQK